MIAVSAASGQLGRLVLEHLLTKTDASNIKAIARSTDKLDAFKAKGIDVRFGDYTDTASLEAALAGVDTYLLISSSEVGQRAPQHKNAIEAAKKAGVKTIVYTSLLQADTSPMMLAQEHKQTETDLKESGLQTIILRNGWYSENYTQGLGAVLEHNAVFGCAENGKLSSAPRSEYAEAAANVLTAPEAHLGKTYELGGDEAITLSDYAAQIGEASGKEIAYNNMTESDFAGLLVQVGLPEGFAAALADSEKCMASGWLEVKGNDLSTLLGRKTSSMADSIKAAL